MSGELDKLRHEIDVLDGQILEALAKRMDIAEELGRFKKAEGIELRDDERFQALLADRLRQGETLGLPEELVSGLYHAIHEAALEREAGA